MDLTVSGRHLEVTEPVHAYATEKAGKLPRYFDRVSKVDVVITRRDNHTYDVEFIAHVDGHDHFVSHGKHEDVYAAIDESESKMQRQLAERKAKLVQRNHGQ